jgi:hypothetical protein
VSALPGGSADKLGNQYEGWWTLLRIGDILIGKASRILYRFKTNRMASELGFISSATPPGSTR